MLPRPLIPDGESPAAKRFKSDVSLDNPLFVPFATAAAAASTSSSSSSAAERERNPSGDPCHFCPTKVPKGEKASHRASHWDVEFQCGEEHCTRY